MNKRCERCRKHAYADEGSVIRWALIRSKAIGRPLRYYSCPYGHGFHLTKQLHQEPQHTKEHAHAR